MFYLSRYEDRKIKNQLTPPQLSAYMEGRTSSYYKMQRFSHWVYPTLHFSTEQCSGLGVMFRLPWSGGNHLFWTEPSVYAIGSPLFWDSMHDHVWPDKDKFYKLSVGIGYRYLMNPSTRLGIYGYYDYTTKNELLDRRYRKFSSILRLHPSKLSYQFSHHPHIFNVGVEIFTPLGCLIGNIYGNSLFAVHKGDIKCVIGQGRCTFAIGVYYGQRNLKGRNDWWYFKSDRKVPGQMETVPIDIWINYRGVACEWKYKRNWTTYGIKYTYDKRNRHRLSWMMQWEPFDLCTVKHKSQLRYCLAPAERYLESPQNNGRGTLFFQTEAEDKVVEEYESHINAPKIRIFRNIFAKKYSNTCGLQSIENYTLKKLKTVSNMQHTSTPLEGYSIFTGDRYAELFLDDAYSTVFLGNPNLKSHGIKIKNFENVLAKGNQLQKLYTARSILRNIIWVDLLHRRGLASIGVSKDNKRFSPSTEQLSIINKFAEISNYFTPFQAEILKNWSDQSPIRDVSSMEDGFFFTTSAYRYYKVDRLGNRLVLLEKMAREVLPYYDPKDTPISQASIISMQDKLNEAIVSNLYWQYTAAFLSDASQSQRKVFFNVAHLPKLPFDIKRDILNYVVQDLLNFRSDDWYKCVAWYRLELLKQDLQFSNENNGFYSNFVYSKRVYSNWTGYLLSYLSSIKTGHDYWHLLAIPENPYSILF